MTLHELVCKSPKIGVFVSDATHCTELAKATAYEVGRLLAQRGCIIFTGGGGGVMEAASRAAVECKGLTVAVSPWDKPRDSNNYYSLCIPTGIGFARGQVLANSVDGAIVIEGGLGTHGEAGLMYWLQKPTVAIRTSGGVAAEIAGRSLDN